MAITAVHPTWHVDGEGELLLQTWRETVHVHVDDRTVSLPEVLAAVGVPQIGDPHPHQPLAHVRRIRPRRSESWYFYKLEVEYTTEQEEETDDPLNESPIFTRSSESIREPAEYDIEAYMITPSTGSEPYDPLPEKETKVRKLTIQRNEELWDADREREIYPFEGSVNDDEFFGWAAEWVKCESIEARDTERAGTRFSQVTYTFLIRGPKLKGVKIQRDREFSNEPVTGDIMGWDDGALLDIGSIYFDDVVNRNIKEFLTVTGNPRNTLGLLNGKGLKRNFKQPGSTPVWLMYKLREKKTFGDLNLGSS